MAELSNTPQFIGLEQFAAEYKTYNERNYTAAENGQAAMEKRDIDRAKQAIDAQERKFGIVLEQIKQELTVPERVRQEWLEVAGKMIEAPFIDFIDAISPKEFQIVFKPDEYYAEMQANAKQLYYTKWALSKEAADGDLGQQFVADF